MEESAPSFVVLYLAGGLGSCLLSVLLVYNLVAVVFFMRERTEGSASGLSKAAWAIGVLAVVFLPCAWFLGLVALVLGRVERGRIYRDQSSLASATPARMAGINGGMAFVVWLLIVVTGFANWVIG